MDPSEGLVESPSKKKAANTLSKYLISLLKASDKNEYQVLQNLQNYIFCQHTHTWDMLCVSWTPSLFFKIPNSNSLTMAYNF